MSEINETKRIYKRNILDTDERLEYLEKKRAWYKIEKNKKKCHEYYHLKYKNRKRMIGMGRRYWIFWPMMLWFAELPNVSLSHQLFYRRSYNKLYYEKNKYRVKVRSWLR